MIRCEGLTKQFGSKRVLDGVDLEIHEGETMVIIGRSGEGKSVLLKHIALLIKPDNGKLWIDDDEVSGFSEKELDRIRPKIGLLFQMAALFDSLTVLENVGFGLIQHSGLSMEEITKKVEENLKMVQLEGIMDKKPAELSGGMKKRVGLARAIATKPKIILYDEPTTGLDPITADAINDLIISMKDELQVTGVAVTHDMVSAYKIADRIAMLNKGKIIAVGTPDEIRSSSDERVQQFIHGHAKGPLTDINERVGA